MSPPQPKSIHVLAHNELCRSSTVIRASRVYSSLLYAVIVFISFFLMLVFMTYNVRNDVHMERVWSLTRLILSPTAGVFDPGDSRRSGYRTLLVLGIERGR